MSPSSQTAVRSRDLVFGYATGGFGLAVNSMVSFLLPLRALDIGIGVEWIGVLLAAKGITEAIASVPIGAALDRVGPRRAYLVGTFASAAIGLGFGAANSVLVLLLLQVALGASRPLAWVGAQTYVASLRDGEDRARDTGRLSFTATSAQIVAPLMVGIVAQATSTGIAFWAFAGYCAAFSMVGLALRPRGESGPSRSKTRASFREGLRLFGLRDIRVAMYLTFVRLWIPSVWTAFFPLYLVIQGTEEGVAGGVVSFMGLVATVISLSAGQASKMFSVAGATALGLAAGAAGLLIAPLSDEMPLSFVSAALVGVGQGLSLPLLIVLVTGAVDPSQRGLALGLRASVNQGAAALAPMIAAGAIGLFGATVGFPVTGGVALVILALAMKHASGRPRQPEKTV